MVALEHASKPRLVERDLAVAVSHRAGRTELIASTNGCFRPALSRSRIAASRSRSRTHDESNSSEVGKGWLEALLFGRR